MKQFDFPKEILNTPEKMVEFNSKGRDEKLDIMWREEIIYYAKELRKLGHDIEIEAHLHKIMLQSEWRKMRMGEQAFG